eukprot:TRINITY_DN88788_c0_g1_i1.p1 TRINITY_DN88788_c0_g1~~TRINITY_DN88788_c0_g1_i1.p1  ORF type:complete len:598 (+),score=86.63 TRINITY_DN88788_c0_g1_i1:94-1887(+)
MQIESVQSHAKAAEAMANLSAKHLVMNVPRPTRGVARDHSVQLAEAAGSKETVDPICDWSSSTATVIHNWEILDILARRHEESPGPAPKRPSPLTRETTGSAVPTPREQPRNNTLLRTVSSNIDDPVGGIPFGSGELLFLDDEAGMLITCVALVFSTGLYLVAHGSGHIWSFAWSPFSVISKTDGRPGLPNAGSGEDCSPYAGISLSIPTRGRHVLLACRGAGAVEQRDRWLHNLSMALRSHVRVAFPEFRISVEPLAQVPDTKERILAGYLLLREDGAASISVPYCELHAHRGGFARLSFYSDESCDRLILALAVTQKTRIFERAGEDCSCFAVDGHSFCARSMEERQVWLRALSNVKVKLANGAPDPSPTDLEAFREAVQERLEEIEATETFTGAFFNSSAQKEQLLHLPIPDGGRGSAPAQKNSTPSMLHPTPSVASRLSLVPATADSPAGSCSSVVSSRPRAPEGSDGEPSWDIAPASLYPEGTPDPVMSPGRSSSFTSDEETPGDHGTSPHREDLMVPTEVCEEFSVGPPPSAETVTSRMLYTEVTEEGEDWSFPCTPTFASAMLKAEATADKFLDEIPDWQSEGSQYGFGI